MPKVLTPKSKKTINSDYQKRKKEKDKALQDEIASLRIGNAQLEGQVTLLKEQLSVLNAEFLQLKVENLRLRFSVFETENENGNQSVIGKIFDN
ncbi:hypothetical protein F8M41_025063 [Gigaspora margarita]|uniref:BZIP domain-containing protein n=1 Tax=Gigaspora margarita TaxID=4874 RepID=A0A8H4ETB4_GIGMA|nr:hypothetical protein F8M41_025063 [Gigaspora margarita]